MLKPEQTPSNQWVIVGTLNGFNYREGAEDEVSAILNIILLEEGAIAPLEDAF